MSKNLIIAAATAALASLSFANSVTLEDGTTWEFGSSKNCAYLWSCTPIKEELHVPEKLGDDTVVSIVRNLFLVDKTVRKVYLPKTLQNIGVGNSLMNNHTLEAIYVDKENPYLDDLDGVLYTEGYKKLLAVPTQRNFGGFPDTLEEIGTHAMHANKFVRAMQLPESVKKLNFQSFAGCHNLQAIYLPDGITVLPPYTFAWDGRLEEVRLPANLQKIGEKAFLANNRLQFIVIPEKVTSIAEDAFMNCKNLRQIAYLPIEAPTNDPFKALAPECVIGVRQESKGWNTPIPGTWNGHRIVYLP